jgi:hypothetical protein
LPRFLGSFSTHAPELEKFLDESASTIAQSTGLFEQMFIAPTLETFYHKRIQCVEVSIEVFVFLGADSTEVIIFGEAVEDSLFWVDRDLSFKNRRSSCESTLRVVYEMKMPLLT